MESKIVTTPSGYTAYVRPELSWGQYRAIQKIIVGGMQLDPNTKKVSNINGVAALEASQKAVEFLVERITDKDGKDLPVVETLDNMAASDAQIIVDVVNEIRSSSEPSKKNTIS